MNGTDLILIIVGLGVIAACFRQMRCERRRLELEERHAENKRHWRVVERCERYGYQLHSAPDYVPEWMEQEAA